MEMIVPGCRFSQHTMINLFEKYIFPNILEKYWELIVKKRTEDDHWPEVAPFVDAFKLSTKKDSPEGKPYPVVACLIPKPLWFWDIILSLYLVYKPDIYKDFPTMAKMIHENVEAFGINPKDYENMDIIHWMHLDCLRSGDKKKILFLQDPIRCLVQIRNVMFLYSAYKEDIFSPDGDVFKKEETIVEMNKCTKDVCDQVMPILGLTYEEYEKEMNRQRNSEALSEKLQGMKINRQKKREYNRLKEDK